MGYISVETALQGEVIIDASRILTLKVLANGNGIDLITEVIETSPSIQENLRLVAVTPGSITQQTQTIFNQAIVAAQNSALVAVNLLPGQEINEVAYPIP